VAFSQKGKDDCQENADAGDNKKGACPLDEHLGEHVASREMQAISREFKICLFGNNSEKG